jgi:hypothetical protein
MMNKKQNEIRQFTKGLQLKCKSAVEKAVTFLNSHFNRLSNKNKKITLVLFGIIIGAICLLLIFRAANGIVTNTFSVQNMSTSKDIYMKNNKKWDFNQLIPIGKMKGEINGEYDSFYVAVDKEAMIYINRNIEYSEKAYVKTNRWEKITREQLNEYAKSLHFIPFQNKNKKALKIK